MKIVCVRCPKYVNKWMYRNELVHVCVLSLMCLAQVYRVIFWSILFVKCHEHVLLCAPIKSIKTSFDDTFYEHGMKPIVNKENRKNRTMSICMSRSFNLSKREAIELFEKRINNNFIISIADVRGRCRKQRPKEIYIKIPKNWSKYMQHLPAAFSSVKKKFNIKRDETRT